MSTPPDAVELRAADARTPWADRVRASAQPAADESQWVERWRGGWQLCFPTAGQPDPLADPPQGFHGAASQAPWEVSEARDDTVTLRWSDAAGLAAERSWRLRGLTLSATTTAVNRSTRSRELVIAEHLILGRDALAPALAGERLRLDAAHSGRLAPLDYDGSPEGDGLPWPGTPAERWPEVDASTPARVAALVDPDPRTVRLHAAGATLTVRWEGLPHALIWEELGRSAGPPWNGQVVALGIEPTSTPHGAGTAGGDAFRLEPGQTLTWSTSLTLDTRPTEEEPA